MTEKLNEAREEVEELSAGLADIIKEIVGQYTENLNNIVGELAKGINLYSNTELWDFQMRLSVEAYELGNVKELASLKDACAEALYKQGLANSFTTSSGTQEIKKQQSMLDTVDKQVVSILYASVASILKTKCDEAHRLVSTIQNIQISRAAEAKQISSPRSEQDRVLLG